MRSRGLKFVLVGAAGFLVQLGVLAVLRSLLGVPWTWATIVAVECAIVHNFGWHARWTWQDRAGTGRVARLAKFHAGTAVTSIGGNLAVMSVLVGPAGLDPLPANAIAVLIVSGLNYLLADRWIFQSTNAAAMMMLALIVWPANAAAEPPRRALQAWSEAVASTEAAAVGRGAVLDAGLEPGFTGDIKARGESVAVDGGTISRWRGAVFIPGITVDGLLRRLQYPGTPPPQDEVVAARVIDRGPDFLRVYMRLVRRAIVTVAYDTEHDMAFRRISPASATARSVATRIDEAGGGDTGFLWKLNSYWRYDAHGDGVRVSVETLTLSRNVPALIKPVAGPIVNRIARESMIRTLTALRDYMGR
jgi:putative flippase GtrA